MKKLLALLLFVPVILFSQSISGIRFSGGAGEAVAASESDTFDGTTLNSSWSFIKGNLGAVTISDGSLKMQTGKGQSSVADYSETAIFKTITGTAWTAEITLDFDPDTNYQNVGLSVGSGYDIGTIGRVFATVDNVERTDKVNGAFVYTTIPFAATTGIHLRLTRSGTDFKAEYSSDGITYLEAGSTASYTLPITTSALVGIYAHTGGGATIATATIYDFTVTK